MSTLTRARTLRVLYVAPDPVLCDTLGAAVAFSPNRLCPSPFSLHAPRTGCGRLERHASLCSSIDVHGRRDHSTAHNCMDVFWGVQAYYPIGKRLQLSAVRYGFNSGAEASLTLDGQQSTRFSHTRCRYTDSVDVQARYTGSSMCCRTSAFRRHIAFTTETLSSNRLPSTAAT